jgi:hypothetical protein
MVAILPSIYAVQHFRHSQAQVKDQAHIEEVARNRGQARLWASFFQQSSTLIQEFKQHPRVCQKNYEDRSSEQLLAKTLLQASHQLAAQGAPNPEAENVRNELHAWLTELTIEEGCMPPERVQELRQWASAQDLQNDAKRLGTLMNREGF